MEVQGAKCEPSPAQSQWGAKPVLAMGAFGMPDAPPLRRLRIDVIFLLWEITTIQKGGGAIDVTVMGGVASDSDADLIGSCIRESDRNRYFLQRAESFLPFRRPNVGGNWGDKRPEIGYQTPDSILSLV